MPLQFLLGFDDKRRTEANCKTVVQKPESHSTTGFDVLFLLDSGCFDL